MKTIYLHGDSAPEVSSLLIGLFFLHGSAHCPTCTSNTRMFSATRFILLKPEGSGLTWRVDHLSPFHWFHHWNQDPDGFWISYTRFWSLMVQQEPEQLILESGFV